MTTDLHDGVRRPFPVAMVGRVPVADLTPEDLVRHLVREAAEVRPQAAVLAYAMHVGGLNVLDDEAYVRSMRKADVVYADGVSVVALARLAGGTRLRRAPTTDVGWAVLAGLQESLARPLRLAVVGGVDGLAARAGAVFAETLGVELVAAEHGYHEDWTPVLDRLRQTEPDALVVGLGMPEEALWCERHRSGLPACVVLTCGGWLGFVVGEEQRAPQPLQSLGLEWAWRLGQSPRRLGRRYAKGALSTLRLAVPALRTRRGTAADLLQRCACSVSSCVCPQ